MKKKRIAFLFDHRNLWIRKYINKKSINFLNELDRLYIEYNVVPSIIKDSRLSKGVFDKCYKFAGEFRTDLKDYDPDRFYKSELSDRLGL